jgi:hypothetical protein
MSGLGRSCTAEGNAKISTKEPIRQKRVHSPDHVSSPEQQDFEAPKEGESKLLAFDEPFGMVIAVKVAVTKRCVKRPLRISKFNQSFWDPIKSVCDAIRKAERK